MQIIFGYKGLSSLCRLFKTTPIQSLLCCIYKSDHLETDSQVRDSGWNLDEIAYENSSTLPCLEHSSFLALRGKTEAKDRLRKPDTIKSMQQYVTW